MYNNISFKHNAFCKWAARAVAVALGAASLAPSPLLAATPTTTTQPTATRAGGMIIDGVDASGQMHMLAGKSSVLTAARRITRYSLSPSEVADASAVAADSLLLTAKKGGGAADRLGRKPAVADHRSDC